MGWCAIPARLLLAAVPCNDPVWALHANQHTRFVCASSRTTVVHVEGTHQSFGVCLSVCASVCPGRFPVGGAWYGMQGQSRSPS